MRYNGVLDRSRVQVAVHFGTDALLFLLAFGAGAFLRFGKEDWSGTFWFYLPGIVAGAFLFACSTYIAGLYSGHHDEQRIKHALRLGTCFLVAVSAMLGLLYLTVLTPVGRGMLFISVPLAYLASLIHHFLIIRRHHAERERVALLMTGAVDELHAQELATQWGRHVSFLGVIHHESYQPLPGIRTLGTVDQLPEIVRREKVQRLLCTDLSINDPGLYRQLCACRYSGIAVTPLMTLCEEIYQCVPLELVRPEWLLQASSQPHLFYISKIKRAFDIVVSAGLLILSAPVLLAGMLLVRLTSRGPVFYLQVRLGRFGRAFRVIKLRTMHNDAEATGHAWASPQDPRLTLVGGFLRKYRIDEIPQFLNILKGEMSFVGPRPERPEFNDHLNEKVEYYAQRLMIHPGLTGWAQVNYPYGASVEDTRRKLEYDLYYMKYMSIFLDLFILLDTVRTVLLGGARELPPPLRFTMLPSETTQLDNGSTKKPRPAAESIYAR